MTPRSAPKVSRSRRQKALVVTFVSGANPNFVVPNLSPGEAGDESNIDFTGYVLAKGAELTISQMTPGGSNTTATVELAAYLTADAAGDDYINDSPLVTGDTPINITTDSVQVIRDGVNVVGTARRLGKLHRAIRPSSRA